MNGFDPARGGALVLEARRDARMTQTALAEASGASQPSIAAIERGARTPSPALLERLLRAADYRPGLALRRCADEITGLGARYGIHGIRVFGSVARGTDHYSSDIDLLVDVEPGRSYFDVGAFVSYAEELTGFPVDVVIDGPNRPDFLDDETVVPL